jgi:uncharacterized protein DUF3489
MRSRAKGATLAEIVEATGWKKHTVRGFVSILGSKAGARVDSSKRADGERTYKISIARRLPQIHAAYRFAGDGVSACVGHTATDGDVTGHRGLNS